MLPETYEDLHIRGTHRIPPRKNNTNEECEHWKGTELPFSNLVFEAR